jgi:large subunit ribosomal protein L19
MKDIIQQIEDRNTDPARKQFGEFAIGDTVEVKVKITEGDKTRIQGFSGTVIARKHGGTREMFTVRRLVDGEGVERTWPLHSPHVVGVEVKRHGVVSRAKLFYLRDRVGKATRLRERQEEEEVKTTEAAAETGTKRRRGAKAKAERRARAAEAAKTAPKKPKKKKKAKAEAGAEAPQA